MNKELLDQVDDCMQMLGISLNLADPNGSTHSNGYSSEGQKEVWEAVTEDYRKLSDAILALRKEKQQYEVSPLTGQLHPTIEDREEEQ